MEVNFFALTEVTRKAMQVMREQKPSGGLIQQVTSIGGQRGPPTYSFYCASKWAVEGFTESVVSSPWGLECHVVGDTVILFGADDLIEPGGQT
jgi:short-subunit dehydrogenase